MTHQGLLSRLTSTARIVASAAALCCLFLGVSVATASANRLTLTLTNGAHCYFDNYALFNSLHTNIYYGWTADCADPTGGVQVAAQDVMGQATLHLQTTGGTFQYDRTPATGSKICATEYFVIPCYNTNNPPVGTGIGTYYTDGDIHMDLWTAASTKNASGIRFVTPISDPSAAEFCVVYNGGFTVYCELPRQNAG